MGLVCYIPRWLYNIFKLIIYSIDSKWRFYYHVLLSKQTNHFLKSERYLKKKKQKCGNKDYRKFIVERQSLSVNGMTTHVVRLARKTGNFQTNLVIFSRWVTYEIVLNPFSSSLLHDHVPLITAEAFRTGAINVSLEMRLIASVALKKKNTIFFFNYVQTVCEAMRID